MWDIGRFAVFLVAPLLARFLSGRRSDGSPVSASQLRKEARTVPGGVEEAALASGSRMLAWMILSLECMIGFASVPFVLGAVVGGSGLIWLMAVIAYAGMFAAASVGVSFTRLCLALSIGYRGFPAGTRKLRNKSRDDAERRRRAAIARQGGPSRIIRWIVTPTVLDVIPALFFALLFGSLIAADIPQ